MQTRIVDIETGISYDVQFSKTSGEETLLCPVCSSTRKSENQKKKCLAWNHDKGTGFCHNNNEKFSFPRQYSKKEYSRPEWKNNTKLSDKVVKWFEDRKIEQAELRRMKITESIEFMPQRDKKVLTINFNYFRDGELINIKYRDSDKNFKLFKDAELIFYGLDDIRDKSQIIIVEGEMDKLAFGSAGIFNVVSVPNGASGSKLEYLDNCIDYFENAEEIILATDEDIPGIQLRNELSSRLGIERCKKVSFKDCKDANEYLIKYGFVSLKEVIKESKSFPVEGIFSSVDFLEDLRILYQNGLTPGLKIGIQSIDDLLTYEFGYVYLGTGIPGHGKSEVLDYIIERLNVLHGLKVAYFSPENFPLQLHASKIIEKLTGQRFSKNSLSQQDFDDAENYLRDNFFWINPEENFNVDSILIRARNLVKTKGVKIVVIDPYNKLENQRKSNQSETEYISEFMDKAKRFAIINNVIFFIIAHPRKINKDATGRYEVPTLYDINGSANWFNKTDFGFCVYRDFETGESRMLVQKVKFKHMGMVGFCTFMWDKFSGRYIPIMDGVAMNDTSNHLKTLIYSKMNNNSNAEDIFPSNEFDTSSYSNNTILNIDDEEMPF